MEKFLNTLDENDFKIFKDIEQLRDKVILENKIIKIIDYGAGNPDENRTIQEMDSGIEKDISTKDLCKIGLKNEFAHLIYAMIKKYQPSTVLELGTCCGFSSIYISMALKNKGIIHTIEGSPQTAKIAQNNFQEAGCTNIVSHIGKFNDALPTLLPNIKPINFVFIDGPHDKNATLKYFEEIKPFLSKNALILFDDISWSDGMREAWEVIKKDKHVESYIDFHKVGLCFIKDV